VESSKGQFHRVRVNRPQDDYLMKSHRLPAFLAAALTLAFDSRTQAANHELLTTVVASSPVAGIASFDAVVEAVRQTAVASQVSGAVLEIAVKAGESVRAGQVMIRLDARAADQNALASDAQVQAARASLDVATQEHERQRQLLQKNYISQAAFERAEAQFKATQAQVSVQLAQANIARTQSGFFVVKAPYAGVVAAVPVAVGDMAMPGRTLALLYDPTALRVTATVPQSAIEEAASGQAMKIELPGVSAERQWLSPARVQVLPTVDPETHTVEVRMDLPRGVTGISPGMFARAWLPAPQASSLSQSADGAALPTTRLYVPFRAIVRRAEMTGLYAVGADGRPALRQVRLGQRFKDSVEILSGVAAGERIALDPQAAVRVR
jgi:multidrug efflux system membrane fusion protein